MTDPAGNDTVLGVHDKSGADLVRTFTLGDKIDGGAGIDTLQISLYDDKFDLGLATITNVEKLVIKNSFSGFDTLTVGNKAFESVTVDYQGTDNSDTLYIDGIKGTTNLTVENITADGSYVYRNNNEAYDATTGTVAVTNTFSNIDTTTNDSWAGFYGYEYFSQATTVNHTLNVTDVNGDYDAGLGENVWVYDYVEASKDNAAINSTINIKNIAATDYDTTEVMVYVQNSSSVAKADIVTAVVNIENVDGLDFWYDSYDSGFSSASDVITYNLNGLANTYGSGAYLGSSGFETINVNVAAGSKAVTNEIYDNDTVEGNQALNIAAAGDLTTDSTYLNGTVANVTITVTGAGNVDLGTAYLGDGGATDVVTVNASASTGNFKVYDSNGYAATITSGSGNDTIKVGGFATVVSTGAGDDKVDTNGFDFGDASAKTIDGGAGRNTIVINDQANLTTAAAANISNFQVLDITGAAGGDTFDMSVESSLDAVVAKGALGAVVIDKAAAGTTVSLTSADSSNSTVASLTYALKTATGTSDNFALSLTASDTDVKANDKDGQLTVSAVIANAIESFSISSNATTTDGSADGKTLFAAKDYTNTISSLEGDAVKTVTLTGAANLTITDVVATTLTKVDASAMTGALTITLDDSANASAVAVLGGSAADTITMTGNLAVNNIIVGNGGADTITLAASGTKETVRIAADTDSVLTLADTTTPVVTPVVMDTAKGFDVITNFISGEDKIELSSALALGTGDARSAIAGKGTFGDGTITDNAELAATLQTLIGSGTGFFNDGTVNRAVATAVLDDAADSTFVFIDTNADGNFTNGVDQAIQLAGVTTVLITDFVFG